MRSVTSQQMRELDRRTIEEIGIPGIDLMERAGAGVAQAVRRLTDLTRSDRHARVWLVAGRGNNGGDVAVAARLLHDQGFSVIVTLAASADDVKGDARDALDRMRRAGIDLLEAPNAENWTHAEGGPFGFVVDGLLGTGTTGPAREPIASAIRAINREGAHALVVAVDVPSGLDADTGAAHGDVVRADMTITMGLPKCGLLNPAALEWVGHVDVTDIGIPPSLWESIDSEVDLITPHDLKPLLPPRRRNVHKGDFGRALLIGGSPGYSGAIALAARAALRSGTGLVTVLTPASVAPIVAGLVPEAMVHPATATPAGTLCADSLHNWPGDPEAFDAILIGPGLTPHETSLGLIEQALRTIAVPIVLDADALNVVTGRLSVLRRDAPVIVTPHPGEMARLLNTTSDAVQADRFAAARRLVDETGAVTVLKGAGTIVADSARPLSVNLTGNPGMATGGTGDVLSGLITGLLAQGLKPADAARLGVYVHGRAGDLAAWHGSPISLIAGDIIEALPRAFRELCECRLSPPH